MADIVQVASMSAGGVSTMAGTFASNTTAGNQVLVAVLNQGTSVVSAIADAAGNTYGSSTSGSVDATHYGAFYLGSQTAAMTRATVTFSGTSSATKRGFLVEVSDLSNVIHGTVKGSAASGTLANASFTTTIATVHAFAVGRPAVTNTSWFADSDYEIVGTQAGAMIEWRTFKDPASDTVSVIGTNSGTWINLVVAIAGTGPTESSARTLTGAGY